MRASSELMLFGFDLSHPLALMRLGLQQLLWGREAGLRDNFAPQMIFLPLESIRSESVELMPALEVQGEERYLAAVMPQADTLDFVMTVPRAVEPYLENVILAEIFAKSPFGAENTSWGFSVTQRGESDLCVTVALAAKQVAQDAFAEISELISSDVSGVELWVSVGEHHIQLRDFQSDAHRTEYLNTLMFTGAKLAAAALGVLLLLSAPAMWISQTDVQLESLLAEARTRSAAAVDSRDRLIAMNEKKARAMEYFDQYVDYRPWLHRLAELTPDSIYLNRLAFDGRSLTISGMALNAAEFQGKLVNTGLFSELSAPSAFVRDERVGRERFTLLMNVPADQEQ